MTEEENWDNELTSSSVLPSTTSTKDENNNTGFSGFGSKNTSDLNNNDTTNEPSKGFGGFSSFRKTDGNTDNNESGGFGGFGRKSGGGFGNSNDGDDNKRSFGGGGSFRREGGGAFGNNRDRDNNGGGGFNRERNGEAFGNRREGGGGGFQRKSFGDRNNDSNGGGGGFQRKSFGDRNNDSNDGGSRFGNRNRDREEGGGSFGRSRSGFGERNRDSGEGGSGGGGGGFGRRDFNGGGGGGGGFQRREKSEGGFERKRDGGNDSFGKSGGGRRDENGDKNEKERERYIPQEIEDTEENLFHNVTIGVNFKKQNEIPASLTGTGSEQIKPLETFDDANLSELLRSNVKKCNYEIPTPVQQYAIPIITQKRDLMACAQTGSGKTAAFILPIMTNILHDGIQSSELMSIQEPQALILAPTRELALQTFNECKKFSYGSVIKSAILYGGVDTGFQLRNLARGCNILIATPGRLLDVLEKGKVSLEKVKYFVLDEADRMLDMGFEVAVRDILKKGQVKQKGDRCTLMFSATFPKEIQTLAQDFLNNYLFLTIGIVGGANTDVEQTIYKVGRLQKRDKCVELLNEIGNEKTMIFLDQKKGADILAFYLIQKGYKVTSIHGDRLQSQRETALNEFKSGKSKIIVCTSVAARGLDIDKVQHVINFDLPNTIDEYVHRIGRTGRCGNPGKAISFFDSDNANDRSLARQLVRTLLTAQQTVPEWLSNEAENSIGTSYSGTACTDDLRDKLNNLNVKSDTAVATVSSSNATEQEESWD